MKYDLKARLFGIVATLAVFGLFVVPYIPKRW
jgi:hypothetical protein